MTSPTALAAVLVGVLSVGALAGCAPSKPAPTSTPTPSATVTIEPTGDGVLRFGTLFPASGDLAATGPAQVAAVEAAVREINEAGGVAGKPVEVLHRDSGDAASDRSGASLGDLVARGTDVVIGPSSAELAQRILPVAVESKVTVISPATSTPELATVDSAGFLFRTSPSYALQGEALGHILPESDAAKVALIYADDALGQSLKESFAASLDEHDGSLVASEPLAASTRAATVVKKIAAAEPDAVVIATSAASVDQTTALITALTDAGLGGTRLWLTSQNLADYSQALPAGVLAGANGIRDGAVPGDAFIARLTQADPAVSDTRFAAEVYDATIAAALAAILVGDDSGRSISLGLPGATSGGIRCRSFGECLDVLKTEPDIDYDGISGPLDFTESGDVSAAGYGIFTYGADNSYARASTWEWE